MQRGCDGWKHDISARPSHCRVQYHIAALQSHHQWSDGWSGKLDQVVGGGASLVASHLISIIWRHDTNPGHVYAAVDGFVLVCEDGVVEFVGLVERSARRGVGVVLLAELIIGMIVIIVVIASVELVAMFLMVIVT